ncbi:MAG: ADP-ribosylglycohydrolase family protein [Planctomycetota bacterium]|jgi:ADP-ribosyl-[dinitrogen reductase] hydrolase
MPPTAQDRYRGCLLGLACGDAVGTTVEFRPRGSFPPVTDMVGGGPFRLEAGQWTDDTAMALCLAESLLECQGFDPRDQMERYCRWWQEGHLSSTGECFDIGMTIRAALERFRQTGEPFSGATDPRTAGNGSLMRLAPVILYYAPDRQAALHYAAESSRTTHGCEEAVDACRLFAAMLIQALAGASKQAVLFESVAPDDPPLAPALAKIAQGAYRDKPEAEIRGTGYVVQSLEAALWCFHTTDSFRDAILAAANLGDDADTTAAICGQIAGAHYGVAALPPKWREQLALRPRIEEMVDGLHASRPA